MKSNNQNIEVFLADDHHLVANGIANLLMSIDRISNVKIFSNGVELYHACLDKLPDLIILDMEMPEWNGIETLKNLRQHNSVPVIMLTMNDEKAVIEESIKSGAKGYLHKNCNLKELETAIETVMQGNIFLSEDSQKIIIGLKQTKTNNSFELTEPLTEKEIEVLKLVCEGFTSKEIGEKLFISPRTVETRKNNLMQKFNVQSTGKLVAAAIKNRFIK